MKMIIMWNKRKIFLIIAFMIFISGCSNTKGIFAYKSPHMDMFRKWIPGIEFNSNEKIKWVFKIERVNSDRSIGVVLMKKEIGWIDINKIIYTVRPNEPNIYGEIENLQPGNYKIVLVERGVFISEVEFKIYLDLE